MVLIQFHKLGALIYVFFKCRRITLPEYLHIKSMFATPHHHVYCIDLIQSSSLKIPPVLQGISYSARQVSMNNTDFPTLPAGRILTFWKYNPSHWSQRESSHWFQYNTIHIHRHFSPVQKGNKIIHNAPKRKAWTICFLMFSKKTVK